MAGSSLEVRGNPPTWLQPETIEDSRSRTSDLKLSTEGLWPPAQLPNPRSCSQVQELESLPPPSSAPHREDIEDQVAGHQLEL